MRYIHALSNYSLDSFGDLWLNIILDRGVLCGRLFAGGIAKHLSSYSTF